MSSARLKVLVLVLVLLSVRENVICKVACL